MRVKALIVKRQSSSARHPHGWLTISVFLILSVVMTVQAFAENTESSELHLTPLNPAFVEWQNKVAAGERAGIMPSPVLYHNDPLIDEKLDLPSRFDLRDSDRISPVKYQGSCGSCWAFSNCGLLEGLMKDSQGFFPDLSENHLIHHHGFLMEPCHGGGSGMALAYFSRWDGPLLEEDDPYNPDVGSNPRAGAKTQTLLLGASIFSEAKSLRTRLQAYLFEKGPLATSMCWDDDFYNASQNAYYCSAEMGLGHGITLVGWDDNKEIDGAPELGAWICKNSWGPKWGEEGFFYLSYHDAASVDECMGLDEIAKPREYGRLYMYDPFGVNASLTSTPGITVYAANVFAAVEDEEIVAVATFFVADGINYTAAIHEGPIVDGTPGTLLSETSGVMEQAGYHTISLPEKVAIKAGDSFTVVFAYQKDEVDVSIPIEAPQPGKVPAQSEAGESYVSTDGFFFQDVTEHVSKGNACIRALTAPKPDESLAQTHPADANEEGFISMEEVQYYTQGWQEKEVLMDWAIGALYLKRLGGTYRYDPELSGSQAWIPD